MSKHRNPRTRYPDYSIANLKNLAAGRWEQILIDAGMPAETLNGRRGRPCPRCGGRDRFVPLPDLTERGAVMCRHCFAGGTDPRPGDGIATLRWWLGYSVGDACRWIADWLGVGSGDRPSMTRLPIERRLTIPDAAESDDRFGLLAEVWRRNMRPGWLARAADLLGLGPQPLASLGVGWSPGHRATTWPMRDDLGRVIGVRLRCPKSARKWAVRGSKAGLFYDPDLLKLERPSRLWIVEGATDTAALLSIGLDVVGVPSAGGGADLLDGLTRRTKPEAIVIVADADGPGLAGAERLADTVMIVAPTIVICPANGFKDTRAWVVAGANRAMVEGVADMATVRRLSVEGVIHG